MAARISPRHLLAGGVGVATLALLVGALLSGGDGRRTEVLGVQFSAETTLPRTETSVAEALTAPTAPVATTGVPRTPSGSVQPTTLGPVTTRSTPTGSVVGSFKVAGHGIGGVQVTLIDALGAQRTTSTDATGRFSLADVVAGTYRLELADPGDDTPLCDALGTCVTTRPLRVESQTFEVTAGRASTVEVSL